MLNEVLWLSGLPFPSVQWGPSHKLPPSQPPKRLNIFLCVPNRPEPCGNSIPRNHHMLSTAVLPNGISAAGRVAAALPLILIVETAHLRNGDDAFCVT